MSESPAQLASAVTDAACLEINESLRRIHHCLDQLTDEQVWWRPTESMNSIANLILHLCGNVGQWIISGVGGAEDTRERQREFDEREPISKVELLKRIDATVAEACTVMSKAAADDLARPRVVQGREGTSGILAIFHSVSHFQGHTQEIAHMTRILTGDDYKFAFVPKSST